MRDPDRIPTVLTELQRYWLEHPDLRLGQILCAMAALPSPMADTATSAYFVEDDVLLDRLERANSVPA